MTTDIAVRELDMAIAPRPKEIIARAVEEADALKDVIEKQQLFSVISGKKFVKCEGWTTLACLRGCLPREVSIEEKPDGRYVATVELIRMSDGAILTRASAECGGPEEPVWQSRAPNARHSMAITRATGKACRIAFSWVMALAGFDVTPLEEMDNLRDVAPAARPEPSVELQDSEGRPLFRGKILTSNRKDDPNGRWSKWGFKGDDQNWYTTFDVKVAEKIGAHKGAHEIVWEPNDFKGRDIIEWRPL